MHVANEQHDAGALLRRQRDRRRGIGDVIATLGRIVGTRSEPGQVRAAFESALQQVLPVQAIALRESASRWAA